MTNLDHRITRSAVRHWKKSGMTEWPTVRQVAKSLGVRQGEIEDHEGYDTFCLTSFFGGKTPLGDHFVEALTPEVDAAWSEYWDNWNRRHRRGFTSYP